MSKGQMQKKSTVRNQQALAKGDDLAQALQCRQVLRVGAWEEVYRGLRGLGGLGGGGSVSGFLHEFEARDAVFWSRRFEVLAGGSPGI